ncbi:unnamed protein product [Litomosoides sigmodontis]|uniref:Uncharacterized protein n=1 Tax=Litomosoides sigmodontis TaxID=42156 RepID=A0A3P6U8V0_LITSI|nr:unnamed protein product [Litomosoides sigmodontis]
MEPTTALLTHMLKLAIIIVTLTAPTTTTLPSQMADWNYYRSLNDVAYEPIASEVHPGKDDYGTDPTYRSLMRNMIMLDENDYEKKDIPG